MASERTELPDSVAARTADNGNYEEYPCVFRWEISDQRLLSRFMERLIRFELAENQIKWYVKRLKFRNVFLPQSIESMLAFARN